MLFLSSLGLTFFFEDDIDSISLICRVAEFSGGVRSLTCYFRHLGTVFSKAGISVTPQNKKQLDIVIRKLVGTEDQNCPSTWREVKIRLAKDEAGFASELKEAWAACIRD
jgi:hypothetical protein